MYTQTCILLAELAQEEEEEGNEAKSRNEANSFCFE
jgi:hypothetical protein